MLEFRQLQYYFSLFRVDVFFFIRVLIIFWGLASCTN